MGPKVVFLSTLCILCSCWGDQRSTQSGQDIPMEPMDDSADDLERDSSLWRHSWKPWNMFKWGQQHSMFNSPLHSSKPWESDNGRRHYHHDRVGTGKFKNKIKLLLKIQQIQFQRTLIRRDSSLVTKDSEFLGGYDTGRTHTSTVKLQSDSVCSVLPRPAARPNGSVRKELVTLMFESMLDCIVESWDIIPPPVILEDVPGVELPKTPSELTGVSKKSKKTAKEVATQSASKGSRTKRIRSSKLEGLEQASPLYQCWWSSPDEKAVIHFKNGNIYEGNISMKSMHGEGRFQWADGTVYLGQFKDNEINGKGTIQWKDDTWYEGDFAGNLRHGRGLYVDSRKRASYVGGWYCGTKHGLGRLVYPSFLDTNSYDGEWEYNVRHGFGSREYTYQSGYKGEWDRFVRDGKGLMIWPNHDFYKGNWLNGVMHGYGKYIWNAYYNNTMSLSSISVYRGFWHKGERNGYGQLNFGFSLGSHYKGEFKDNKKHGPGKLVTNNGLILRNSKMLFNDDSILGPATTSPDGEEPLDIAQHDQTGIYQFNISDETVGLMYHIQRAFQNIDREEETRANIISDYLSNNKVYIQYEKKGPEQNLDAVYPLEDILQFEERSLINALRTYENDLKNIYLLYASICNTEEINFQPVLIRLYLWQFYNDCNMHEKGLYFVEIDRIFHECPDLLSQSCHNPFEKIYFWQFLHSCVSVASRLYAKKQMPGVRPDTILASAFRDFMENDVLPGCGLKKGLLSNGFGSFIPLKGAYQVYRCLGEPHTVRKFLCATRHPPHSREFDQPTLVDPPDEETPIGRNAYPYGDKMTFVTDEPVISQNVEKDEEEMRKALQLFNFANLSSKSIIKIFSEIFPQLYNKDKIMDLEKELTFYEFFEAFVACAQKSIRVKEDEMRWKEKFAGSSSAMPKAPSTSRVGTPKKIILHAL